MMLSIDLILTMRDPFSPGKRRMKWYLSISVLLAFFFVWVNTIKMNCSPYVCDGEKPIDFEDEITGVFSYNGANFIMVMILSVNILVGLYSCAFAMSRLSQPGVNDDLRKFFMKKHVAYVFMFTFIWTLNIAGSYYNLYIPNNTNSTMS
jgi:hypothetical protein